MAEGRSSWWLHAVGGVTSNAAPLPHWLGAGFIRVLSGWIDPALAKRSMQLLAEQVMPKVNAALGK